MLLAAIESSYWQFENEELADVDLIDKLVLSICDTCGVVYPHFRLHLVISELVTNAIDHGVLGLQSQLKDTESGFDFYYANRTEQLKSITAGWISLSVEWTGEKLLRISLQDSGAGFDFREYCKADSSMASKNRTSLCGRGLVIIRSLCESVKHIGRGNCIVVEFNVTAA